MSKTTDKVIDLMNQDLTASLNGSLPKENIYKSLSAFQQECPVIHKGTKGYGYSYADLPTIFNVVNPLLKKHNLGFTQLIDGTQLRTILFHTKTGDTIESCADIPQDVQLKGMNTFQVYGSAITYFRRYALSSLLGIITDKDTDASGEQIKKKPQLTAKQLQGAIKKLKSKEVTLETIKKHYELTDVQLKTLELC